MTWKVWGGRGGVDLLLGIQQLRYWCYLLFWLDLFHKDFFVKITDNWEYECGLFTDLRV